MSRPTSPTAAVFAGLVLLVPAALFGQAPGSDGYQTKAEKQQEFIGKLRRDIAKVAHSVEVTKELITRSRGAPFLPDIYLRLAELYVEQARYEFYLVHEERGESSKGSVVAPTARLLKQKAAETYRRVLSEWPEFKDNDKVIFFLAHELRELGDYEAMIRQYENLVTKYPKSTLVLDAYLVLGDYRFDKQDLVGAKRYYQKILDSPHSSVHGMAHFKMGWVYLNETDYKEALHHFESAIVASSKSGKGESKKDEERLISVKREALIDLAFAYTEVKKPKGALKYFRGLSDSRSHYLLALRKLAKRYFIKQNYNAASMAYREITRLSHDAELNLDFTSRIYESSKRAHNYNLVHRDVEAMLRALDTFRFDWRIPRAQRKSAEKDFELISRDLSTRAQGVAVKKKNTRLLNGVTQAYARYLESFPKSKHQADVLANLADTLFEARDYARAGDRFEELAELAKTRKAKEEALYNACASFHEALREAHKLPRFDRIWAQQGLIRNGVAYVEAFPKSQKVPKIKLNIGRSYYEAGDFDRAVGVFDEFIAQRPGHPSSIIAADLILDSFAQRQDYAAVATRARQFAKTKGLGSAAFKQRMLRTAKGAEERQIGEVILTASVDRPQGGDAGSQLKDYWEKHKNSPVAEKTLYTAFVQYKEARNLDKVFETGNQFIGAYPKSQYLGDVFGTLASFTSQTGEYEQAAVFLEEFYKAFPRDRSAQDMLAQAGTIKQLSGDHRGAISNFRELLRRTSNKARRAEYIKKMLHSYERLSDWDGMEKAARQILRNDPENLRAHLMLGLSAQKAGKLRAALRSFQSAVSHAGRSSEDSVQDDAARAAFLAGDVIFRQFERVSGESDVQAATEKKAELLTRLEEALGEAVDYNRGEWAVAALHRAALAYTNFGTFLQNAPVPEGLSADETNQYRQLVGEQANAIRQKGEEYFTACVQKARELRVFSGAVLGCIAKSDEQRVKTPRLQRASSSKQKKASLRQALAQNPKDLNSLADLADYFLRAGKPAKAKLTASRGLEVDDRDGRFYNKIGMAELLLGNIQAAYFGFQRAADLRHPYANANVVALLLDFKDTKAAKRLAKRVDREDLPKNVPDLHPDASQVLTQLKR